MAVHTPPATDWMCSLLSKALTRPRYQSARNDLARWRFFYSPKRQGEAQLCWTLSDTVQCCGLTNKQMNKRGLEQWTVWPVPSDMATDSCCMIKELHMLAIEPAGALLVTCLISQQGHGRFGENRWNFRRKRRQFANKNKRRLLIN